MNEEPTVDIYLQWIYKKKVPISQAIVLTQWLNKFMNISGFQYIFEEQIGPDREQIFPPSEVIEGEPIDPFYPSSATEEDSPITEEERQRYENWKAKRDEQPSPSSKLVWPPIDDAELLFDQSFMNFEEMSDDDKEDYIKFLKNGEDFL